MRVPTTSLGDFPIDEEDVRLSVTSNALAALDTFNPPSPVLTPSQLSFTWSSGEIPILLYDNAYLKHDGIRCSISSVNSESLTLQRISSSLDMTSLAEGTPPASQEWRTRVTSAFSTDAATVPPSSLSTSDSHATLSSVGTFGLRRNTIASGGWRRTAVIPTDALHLNTLFSDPPPLDACTEPSSVPICPSLPDTCLSQKRPLSVLLEQITDNLEATSVSKSSDDDEDHEASVDPNETFVASPTPTTLSWISSRDWTWQEYKDYVSQEASMCYERARPDSQVMASADFTSPTKGYSHRAALQQQDLNTPKAKHVVIKEDTPRSSVLLKGKIRTVLQPRQDQDTYPWLKDTTVQLMIDQEGFRAAEPLFQFASVGNLRTNHDTTKPSSTIMAQFRPSSRQTFHFHYAPFETPPILRRVIINADESHDFISRQAHLTLKNNGVYVVHGHEMSLDQTESGRSAGGHQQKLYWQFEYFVDDRRVESSGRLLEGEKVLIPLTFACSPKLLLSIQGKRVNIVQVFKKGVAPKIVAEKLQPPSASSVVSRPSSAPESASGGTGSSSANTTPTKRPQTSSPSKSPIWTLHRRVQSHNIRQPDTPKPSFPSVMQHPPSKGFSPLPWFSPPFKGHDVNSSHRRAASASDSGTPELPYTQPTKHRKTPTMVDPPVSRPLAQTSKHRHIIPPYKFEEYVNVDDRNADSTRTRQNVMETTNEFTPLTPRPRQSRKGADPVRRSS